MTESLRQTDCNDLMNQTHLIVLRVVLQQYCGYLYSYIYIFFYFNSWDVYLSSDCVIQMDL